VDGGSVAACGILRATFNDRHGEAGKEGCVVHGSADR
jgi:hypothetical protein